MPVPEELTLDAGPLRLAALAWGEPGAPAVLALHGWLDNAASFERLAPLLGDHRVIALELPGHGHSQHRPPGVPYHFVDYVGEVVRAADALGLARFSLLGHSLGAAVASVAAGVFAERIERVALIEGFGPFSSEHADAPTRLRGAIEEMDAVPAKRTPVYESLEQAARARHLVSDFGFDEALVLARRGTARRDGGYVWRSDPRLRVASPAYLCEAQIAAFLRAITAPALLIRSARGMLHKRPQLANRYPLVHDLRIRDMPGGHHVHLDSPGPVAAVLRPFLAGVETARAQDEPAGAGN